MAERVKKQSRRNPYIEVEKNPYQGQKRAELSAENFIDSQYEKTKFLIQRQNRKKRNFGNKNNIYETQRRKI